MKGCKVTLLPIEKISAWYCALTSVLMVVMMPRLADPVEMLLTRVEWLALTAAVIALSYYLTHSPRTKNFSIFNLSIFQLSNFLRVLAQMAWLPRWYPDTYEFNRTLPNLDLLFAAFEQSLFGCQPSIEFSQALPGALWSEAFNLGYFSYFPMIAALVITIFILESRNPSTLNRPPWGTTGGSIIDTPGIRGFGTFDFEREEVSHYFREIFQIGHDCRFSNCTHTHEPGCAVLKALDNHEIAESRYRSYLSMLQDEDEGKYREKF